MKTTDSSQGTSQNTFPTIQNLFTGLSPLSIPAWPQPEMSSQINTSSSETETNSTAPPTESYRIRMENKYHKEINLWCIKANRITGNSGKYRYMEFSEELLIPYKSTKEYEQFDKCISDSFAAYRERLSSFISSNRHVSSSASIAKHERSITKRKYKIESLLRFISNQIYDYYLDALRKLQFLKFDTLTKYEQSLSKVRTWNRIINSYYRYRYEKNKDELQRAETRTRELYSVFEEAVRGGKERYYHDAKVNIKEATVTELKLFRLEIEYSIDLFYYETIGVTFDELYSAVMNELQNRNSLNDNIQFPMQDNTDDNFDIELQEILDDDNDEIFKPRIIHAESNHAIKLLTTAIESNNPRRVMRIVDQLIVEIDVLIQGEYTDHMWTPLHLAACLGNSEIVSILLELDPIIDAEDINGDTPLILATKNQNPSIVELLLEYGANPHLVNDDDKTAEQIATSRNLKRIMKIFAKYAEYEQHDKELLNELDGASGEPTTSDVMLESSSKSTTQNRGSSSEGSSGTSTVRNSIFANKNPPTRETLIEKRSKGKEKVEFN